jgi:hypothetical protein
LASQFCLHELLNPILANADAACQQFLAAARPARATTCLGMNGLDMHQQGIIAEIVALRTKCS